MARATKPSATESSVQKSRPGWSRSRKATASGASERPTYSTSQKAPPRMRLRGVSYAAMRVVYLAPAEGPGAGAAGREGGSGDETGHACNRGPAEAAGLHGGVNSVAEIHGGDEPLVRGLHWIIRMAVRVLAILMTGVIAFGVADVVYVLYKRLMAEPAWFLEISDILATFGAFMAVLIAIEIFVNIVSYLREDVIHVRIVLATALMAIARKVIILDYRPRRPSTSMRPRRWSPPWRSPTGSSCGTGR